MFQFDQFPESRVRGSQCGSYGGSKVEEDDVRLYVGIGWEL